MAATAGQSAQAAIIYSEDFESGSAPGFILNDLWHVTSNFPGAGTYALGFIQGETQPSPVADGNYNGLHNAQAFSPAIAITAGAVLTLQAFNHNEYGHNPNRYDDLVVGMSSDRSTSGTVLASTNVEITSPPALFSYWTPDNTGYQTVTINLSAYENKIEYLSFQYLTLDDMDNAHPGARIDSVVITAADVPEPPSLALLGMGALALGAVRRRRWS